MYLLTLIISVAVTSVLALDNDESTMIESDLLVHDRKSNASEWTGNVKVKEGPYLLRADKLRAIFNEGGEIVVRITATGNPVRIDGPFQNGHIHLEGEIVVYDKKSNLVLSKKKAKLVTDKTSLSSSTIIYDLVSKELKAKGSVYDQTRDSGPDT